MKRFSDAEFIKLNRKILDWQWYSEPCTRDVFIHCLLMANWCDGEWHGYRYKRGQLITSLPSLSLTVGFSIQRIRTALKNLKSTGEITDWYDNKVRIITIVNYDKYQSDNRQAGRRLTDGQQSDCVTKLLTSKKSAKNQQASQQAGNDPRHVDITGVSHDATGLYNSQSNSPSTGNQQATNRQSTSDKEDKKYKEDKEEGGAVSGAGAPSPSAPEEKSIYERMQE